jgi:hypothetical protein
MSVVPSALCKIRMNVHDNISKLAVKASGLLTVARIKGRKNADSYE